MLLCDKRQRFTWLQNSDGCVVIADPDEFVTSHYILPFNIDNPGDRRIQARPNFIAVFLAEIIELFKSTLFIHWL